MEKKVKEKVHQSVEVVHEVMVQPTVQLQHQDNSIESFISQAIDKQLPIETMEKFLAMRKDFRAEQAKEAYVMAMAKLQGSLPTIKKLKANAGIGKYAPIEDIVSQSKQVIADNNFSYNWDTITAGDDITVICKATHSLGHSETSTMVSKIAEGTKVNTEPQKAAITITYLKRYTFCNLFGIVVADEDQDARIESGKNKISVVPTTVNPKAKIIMLLRLLGVTDTKDAEATKEQIVKFVQLEPTDEHIPEIVSRLEVLVQEKNESN